MRSKLGTTLLLAAWVTGCDSADAPKAGGGLPEIKGISVVSEIRPQNRGAYVLVYRTSLGPDACEALDAEIEKVWAAVRPRAEESQASFAHIIAEGPEEASAVGVYLKPSGQWKRRPSKDGPCAPR